MLRRLSLCLLLLAGLAACTDPALQPRTISDLVDARETRIARRDFIQVVTDVEPVAERMCRQRTPQLNCDFNIVVDDRPRVPPGAFIALDENERPTIVITLALIDEMDNIDELAFVISHEAAHHISEHFRRGAENAAIGAQVFAELASRAGATSQEAIEASQQLGALVGVRTYSREFELEADALGTRITASAGYNPRRGAEFFNRIPDPGDQFLGSHPPNAERLALVNRIAGELGF